MRKAVSASTLKVTEEHPFLINGELIPAKQLAVGDLLSTADGKKARITSIKEVVPENAFLVYNLEAGEYSNFIAGEVVVHNSNPKSPISSLPKGVSTYPVDMTLRDNGVAAIKVARKLTPAELEEVATLITEGAAAGDIGAKAVYWNGEVLIFKEMPELRPDFYTAPHHMDVLISLLKGKITIPQSYPLTRTEINNWWKTVTIFNLNSPRNAFIKDAFGFEMIFEVEGDRKIVNIAMSSYMTEYQLTRCIKVNKEAFMDSINKIKSAFPGFEVHMIRAPEVRGKSFLEFIGENSDVPKSFIDSLNLES